MIFTLFLYTYSLPLSHSPVAQPPTNPIHMCHVCVSSSVCLCNRVFVVVVVVANAACIDGHNHTERTLNATMAQA